jgi:hypothetical protein
MSADTWYTFTWDENGGTWIMEDGSEIPSVADNEVSDDWTDGYGIEIGSNSADDSYYMDNVVIHNNVFYDDASEAVDCSSDCDGWGDGTSIYFEAGGTYSVVDKPEPLRGTIKGVKGVDTGGGELNLKGCENVEMKNLDLHNVKVNIVDSKNIDMAYSSFKSDFPIDGSMVEFGGDSHDVTLSHSMFDMSYPEELHASIGIISTIEQPKPIKNVKEEVEMATSLSVTLWILVFVVALVAAVTAKRASWRSLLWPIKKLFKRAEAEGKKVEEEWNAIE